jgi:hypothetical protein
MNEPIKDSIILIREVQITELKENYDGAVSVIEDQRLENELQAERIVKLKKHRKILLSVSGGLAGLVAILMVIK